MEKTRNAGAAVCHWVGTAYLICLLAAYPLYIHTFVDLGITKFTGYLTLSALWLPLAAVAVVLWLCTRPKAVPSVRKRKNPRLVAPLLMLAATGVSTWLSMDPHSSVWGLGSYYGGLMLIVFGVGGYFVARFLPSRRDVDLILGAFSLTGAVVVAFNLLNLLDIDLLGAYAGMADIEKTQFYSTIGQMDFVASFLSLTLPVAVYSFLSARSRGRLVYYGLLSAVFMLGLSCVSADCLLLGTLGFGAAVICLPGFDTTWLRRALLCGAAFFGWDCLLWWARESGWHFNVAAHPLSWSLAQPGVSLPCAGVCLLGWLVLLLARRKKAPVRLYRAGRAVVVLAVAAVAVLLLVANLSANVVLPAVLQDKLRFGPEWGTGRGETWAAVCSAFADATPLRMLFGYGPGMTHSALVEWSNGQLSAWVNTYYAAHNEYLELLLCSGAVGLAIWVVFAFGRTGRGLRRTADPAVAAVALALVSYLLQSSVNIRVSMVFPEVLALLGLLDKLTESVPALSPKQPPALQPPARRPRHTEAVQKTLPPAQKGLLWPLSMVAAAAGVLAALWPLSHLLWSFLWNG